MSIFYNVSIELITNSTSVFDISTRIQFSIYIIFNVLSVVCSLFILYYLLFDRTLRRALNNHVIIVLLFIGLINELISIPWTLYEMYHGVPIVQTPTFCLFSFFFDQGIYSTQIALFAWAAIERHILIFYDRWVSTRKKRWLVHYLPIIIILIYYLVYYSLISFGPFCENSIDIFSTGCSYTPCVFDKTVLGIWDLMAHQFIPTLIIVIFSIALIGRVLRQKRKMNQPIQWRKHRKMTIQLLSVSTLYIITSAPWIILIFAVQYGLSRDIANEPLIYPLFFRSFVIFLFPFVCCGSLSELRDKVKPLFICCHQRQRIAPQILLQTTPRLRGQVVGPITIRH